MPTLILEQRGIRRGGVLPRRVLIGRRSMNHFIIEHRAVSRIHAWISSVENGFILRDANSRTGTKVNGRRVTAPYPLIDGDTILVGVSTLTFFDTDDLPPDVQPMDLSIEPEILPEERGVLFNCLCGAPLWASLDYVGHQGQCTYCGRPVKVPEPADATHSISGQNGHATAALAVAPPAAIRRSVPAPVAKAIAAPPEIRRESTGDGSATSRRMRVAGEAIRPVKIKRTVPAPPIPEAPQPVLTCGVCQSRIASFEDRTSCPDCGLTFHAECWEENYGCSAYGCKQVNALLPPDAPEAAPAPESVVDTEDEPPPGMPWEFVLLAASVFAVLLGAVTFGVPSLLAAVAAIVYLKRKRGEARTMIILASAALGVVGIATGVAVSYVLYR